MNNMNYTELKREIKEYIKKDLNHKRYKHVRRVARLSKKLALQFDVDPDKAVIAGLAHDLARLWSEKKLLSYIEKKHFEMTELEKKHPFMLHGLAAGLFLRSHWDFHDQDIFNAVRFHTTGRRGMSKLEKIIFLADYLEPGRKHLDKEIKKIWINEDLDKILLIILEKMLGYQLDKGKKNHPWTLEMYEELVQIERT